jgi:hypothetical protein
MLARVVNMTKLAKIDGMGRTRLVHVLLRSGSPPDFPTSFERLIISKWPDASVTILAHVLHQII